MFKTINSEQATAAGIIAVGLIILSGLAIWVFAGSAIDQLISTGINFNAGSGMPISQERVNVINWITTGFRFMLISAILLPGLIYGIIVAKRKSASEVFD